MQLEGIEDKNGRPVKKDRHSERNPSDDNYLNIEGVGSSSPEISRTKKIKYKRRRKNSSKNFKEYFTVHEKVGQIFIAILIVSFLYTVGYFLEHWDNTGF